MAEERSLIAFKMYQEASNKFDHLVTGVAIALVTYLGVRAPTTALGFNPSTLEIVALLAFMGSAFCGLKHLERNIAVLVEVHATLHQVEGAESLTDVALKAPGLIASDGKSMTPVEALVRANAHRAAAGVADRKANQHNKKAAKWYRARNFLLLLGLSILALSRILAAWQMHATVPLYLSVSPSQQATVIPLPAEAASGVSNVEVGALTALAALVGVGVTQWGARRTQQAQTEAAASLDRERRNDEALREQADRDHQIAQERAKHEHETAEELAKRAHETQEESLKRQHEVDHGLWKQRCAVYAEFESAVDLVMRHALLSQFNPGVGVPTILDIAASNDQLKKTEALLYLVATQNTAKMAVLVAQMVRELGSATDEKVRNDKLETLKSGRHLFIVAARKDLGIEGDPLDFAFKKKEGTKAE